MCLSKLHGHPMDSLPSDSAKNIAKASLLYPTGLKYRIGYATSIHAFHLKTSHHFTKATRTSNSSAPFILKIVLPP